MQKLTRKGFGVLALIALSSLLLVVCSGTKPTEQTTQPQPAAAPATPQPAAAPPAATAPEGGAAVTGEVAAGQAVFQKNCALCHYTNTTQTKIGPGLQGLFKHKELPMHDHPTSDATVREQIEKGNPAKGMPPFGTKLTPAEIDNLIAYLKTL